MTALRSQVVHHFRGFSKSHLAQTLRHEVSRRGFDVGFISAARMLGRLHAGRADVAPRPHQGLGDERIVSTITVIGNRAECRERLGGQPKFYYRQAA